MTDPTTGDLTLLTDSHSARPTSLKPLWGAALLGVLSATALWAAAWALPVNASNAAYGALGAGTLAILVTGSICGVRVWKLSRGAAVRALAVLVVAFASAYCVGAVLSVMALGPLGPPD